MTAKKTILISGAGIGGCALAYWLQKKGFEPVIVERASQFREGGYILDLWGIGYDVAERMGLAPVLHELGYMNDQAKFVDKKGRVRSGFGSAPLHRALGDRFVSIQRGDLAHAIYELIRGKVETIFGDEITAVTQNANSVEVRMKSGTARSFDLVVGADGLHSAVRTLMSGKSRERYLRYYAAVFVTDGYSKCDEHVYYSYSAPGRQISRFALRDGQTGFLLVFAKKDFDPTFARTRDGQKRELIRIFSQDPWIEWPEVKRHLEDSQDLYFDAVSQIELKSWSNGRVALVGDAAYCPSLLAGEGAAFAMAGAYILAGELERADGDHKTAFRDYEKQFRPFIERKQKSARAFAASFTPTTSFGLYIRDLVLRLTAFPFVADRLVGQFVSDRYSLPEY